MGKVFENIWASVTKFFEELGKDADVLLTGLIKIIAVLVLAKISIVVLRHIIRNVLRNSKKRKPFSAMARKTETLQSIATSVSKYIIYFFVVTSILGIVGLGDTVSSMLATAGIGGIAIAFGAQSLVKDVVSGMFMLLENQFSVGEYVDLDGEKGTIETVAVRTTSIKKFTGEITTIPNGAINKVTNYSRGDHLAIVDMPMTYETDIETAGEIMRAAGLDYMVNHDNILEEPHVLGIIELGDSKVVLRMIIRVKPLTHWETERSLRRLIKERFKERGIDMPYPRRVVLSK
jgi:small conductance mechanosensitive channel